MLSRQKVFPRQGHLLSPSLGVHAMLLWGGAIASCEVTITQSIQSPYFFSSGLAMASKISMLVLCMSRLHSSRAATNAV